VFDEDLHRENDTVNYVRLLDHIEYCMKMRHLCLCVDNVYAFYHNILLVAFHNYVQQITTRYICQMCILP